MARGKRSNWTRHALVFVAVAITTTAATAVPTAAEDKQREWTIETKCAYIEMVAISSAGHIVAYHNTPEHKDGEEPVEGKVWLYDLRTGSHRYVSTAGVAPSLVTAAMFSADDRFLAGAVSSIGDFEFDQSLPAIWIWNVETGEVVATLDMHDNEESCAVSFSADSRWLVGGAGYGGACFWDFRQVLEGEKRPRHEIGVRAAEGFLRGAAISQDGRSIILAGRLYSKSGTEITESVIQVWDADTGSLRQVIPSDDAKNKAWHISCSPVSNEFAVNCYSKSRDEKTIIYELESLTQIAELPGVGPAYSRDGQWIATQRPGNRRKQTPSVVLITERSNPNNTREITYNEKGGFIQQFTDSGELVIVGVPKDGLIRVRKIDNPQR